MLIAMTIRGFKRFEDVEIQLGNPVVFVGPNNSGKTSALQALALWAYGVRKWSERRRGGSPTKRPGVSINRRELTNIPLVNSYSLWRNLRVRNGNAPIRIEIEMKGTDQGIIWTCGMEFETVDQENIRVRPIKIDKNDETDNQGIPDGARAVKVAFLPPMSGLVSQEDLLQPGSIDRRIGEGRTADVLRNLCYRVYNDDPDDTHPRWRKLTDHLDRLFGVKLQIPEYNRETGTLSLSYKETSTQTEFDLNASGQGFRQTLMLLTYLYLNEQAVMLLDEPDAHLEILRQRQIYNIYTEIARDIGSQVVIATHSEVILDDAAQRDLVIAFTGRPHTVTKSAQVRKALAEYGYDDYTKAEQRGWILYVEGANDLKMLMELAKRLEHPAENVLQSPFVHYVSNQPKKAQEHFYAIRDAFPGISGIGVFDRLDRLPEEPNLVWAMWTRRELENYIAYPEVLLDFVVEGLSGGDPLFSFPERARRQTLMQSLIDDEIPRAALANLEHPFWLNTKMSDDFLTPLFVSFYDQLGIPNELQKSGFHRLVAHVPLGSLAAEISEKLDRIVEAARLGEAYILALHGTTDDADIMPPA
ncbi:MAG: AAA family ATPase [Chloroflexota bacterium]|nr:AAA family ATPase [Chloroflexota bacterium]